MATEKILIIDDSHKIRSFLSEVLHSLGYVVSTASDGKRGLDKALAERPDLILLDLNLPRLSGIEVLEALHKDGEHASVILMTAHGSESVAVQAFRLGVRDYLTKPFEAEQILEVIEKALAESRLRRERDQLMRRLEQAKRQLEWRVVELSTINEIAQTVTSSLDLDQVIRSVMRGINRILRVETGSLLLVDEKTNELVFKITLQGDTEKLAPYRLKMGQGIAGWVAQQGEPLLVPDVRLDPRHYGAIDETVGFTSRSILCVPLIVKGKVIGVIEVINKLGGTFDPETQFDKNDLELLKAMAAPVAIAIENARLHEATKKLVAADILQQTVVTVAHYINNPLTALAVSAHSLVSSAEKGRLICHDDSLSDTVRLTEKKVEEIAAVIGILKEMASPKSTIYLGETKMIDIREQLAERLRAIEDRYKK